MNALALSLLLLAAPASAQKKPTLKGTPSRSSGTVIDSFARLLEKDKGMNKAERGVMVEALRLAFGADGKKPATPSREKALRAAANAVVEGSFDQAPTERTAAVAYSAYHAVSGGASPEAAQGIALYGFRKKVPAAKIAEWAKGYTGMVGKKVAPDLAAEMIKGALEGDWDSKKFAAAQNNLLKAALKGVDQRQLARSALAKAGVKGPAADLIGGAFGLSKAAAKAKSTAASKSKPAPAVKVKPKAYGAPAGTRMAKLWPPLHSTAKTFLGVPYVWGGTTREGTDCSGFTQTSYTENGVPIPRVSKDQWKIGKQVEWKDLRPGDLVFFDTLGHGLSHVGMMTDNKEGLKFMHASSSKGVMVADLEKNWFKTRYLGARRVVAD